MVEDVRQVAIDPDLIEKMRGRIRSQYKDGTPDHYSLMVEWTADDYPMEVGVKYDYERHCWRWYWSHGAGTPDGMGEVEGSVPYATPQDAFDAAMLTAATLIGINVWGLS